VYRSEKKVGLDMWIADGWKDYKVIDCSISEKLEQWGDYIMV